MLPFFAETFDAYIVKVYGDADTEGDGCPDHCEKGVYGRPTSTLARIETGELAEIDIQPTWACRASAHQGTSANEQAPMAP